jgi:MGT family glycosyltransferase
MNLVGIAQGLRELGYDTIFILEPGLEGTAAAYGFEERYLSCMPPMSPEEQARYWDDFMMKYMPTFRSTPLQQVGTYVKACWEALIDTSKWSVKNGLADLLSEIAPDLIINDNVIAYPATSQAGCPWVRMISCSENEIRDPAIPPHLSGCREGDEECFLAYQAEFESHLRPVHEEFMDFLESCGCERVKFPDFVLPSPHLNLLLYPKPLRFRRRMQLDPAKFIYLDGCVRREAAAYTVPEFARCNDEPLIYFSYGSLGVADVDLIKRIIGVLADAPYRVLVNVGSYREQYDEVPGNVVIDSWFPQTAVLPHAEVFITHGGNNSFNESLYFGVPPLIMPFVWDGHDNAARVNDTRHGIGMNRYDWKDEELLKNIDLLLSDAEILTNVRNTSEYMQREDGRMRAARAVRQYMENL